jgi:RNA polymerase sigma factor (sigma-70 family)
MAPGHMDRVVRQFRQAPLPRDGGLSDGQLLACFIERRDEAAFAALVRRHGPMVLGVCRRVLHDWHAAEDAFQATFLVLVRKAASLRSRELVANWLYGTAYRTALEGQAAAARRRARERPVEDVPDPRTGAEAAGRELRAALDHELSRLPEKYRLPVVLCDLEGRGRKEVARQLRLSEGTLSSRLARARKLLAGRLSRCGLALPGAALLAADEASARVPVALAGSTTRTALLAAGGQAAGAGAVPAEVAALAEGVLKTMLLTKVKTASAVLLGVAVLGLGTGGLVYRTRLVAAAPPEAQRAQAPAPEDPAAV